MLVRDPSGATQVYLRRSRLREVSANADSLQGNALRVKDVSAALLDGKPVAGPEGKPLDPETAVVILEQ
jgi:hypothetical protein